MHADIATPTPIDRAERANKWVVLALEGTAAFMTTLDSSIVNFALDGWQRAEALREEGPYGVQSLLDSAVWDAEAGRDDMRA